VSLVFFLFLGWSVLRTGAAAVWGATTEIVKDIQTTVAYVTWILFFLLSLSACQHCMVVLAPVPGASVRVVLVLFWVKVYGLSLILCVGVMGAVT
jgi:hypothetical protein